MKKLLKLLALISLTAAAFGCDTPTDEPTQEPQLEVTTNNISGSWQLSLWNEQPLSEGNYVYIDFVRADRTYTMYQNVDSFGTRTITGRFYIYVDESIGAAVLRGDYDHGAGEWNHRYIVENLTADTMRLVAKDDSSDVCVYTRATIPTEIAEAK